MAVRCRILVYALDTNCMQSLAAVLSLERDLPWQTQTVQVGNTRMMKTCKIEAGLDVGSELRLQGEDEKYEGPRQAPRPYG